MDAIKFNGYNVIYAEGQHEYIPMPVHKSKDGTLTVCWQLSLRERVKLLFTGKIWQSIMTFNEPLQPQLLTCNSLVHNPGR